MVNPIDNAAMKVPSLVDDGGFSQKLKTAKQDIGVFGGNEGGTKDALHRFDETPALDVPPVFVLPPDEILGEENTPKTPKEKLASLLHGADYFLITNTGARDIGFTLGIGEPSDEKPTTADLALKAGNILARLNEALNDPYDNLSEQDKEGLRSYIKEIKEALKNAGIDLGEYLVAREPWDGGGFELKPEYGNEMVPL